MNIQSFNRYCQTLPHSTHVVQWGGSQVWKVGGKMFAVCSQPKIGGLGFTFKCSELSYQLLVEQPGCRTAPYFKDPWVQCFTQEALDDAALKLYIGESYKLIFAKLTKRLKGELI